MKREGILQPEWERGGRGRALGIWKLIEKLILELYVVCESDCVSLSFCV